MVIGIFMQHVYSCKKGADQTARMCCNKPGLTILFSAEVIIIMWGRAIHVFGEKLIIEQ